MPRHQPEPPSPPDPRDVVSRASRGSGEDLTDSYRRYSRAADLGWEKFGNPPPEDVVGAIDLGGDTPGRGAGENLFGQMLTDGPYAAVPFLGEEIHLDEFYAQHSDAYLAPYSEGNLDPRLAKGFTPSSAALKGGGVHANDPSLSSMSMVSKVPAPITEAPTSTINPRRPRTVAAGYDGLRRVLTVVFRDGTFYNYYGVDGNEWGNFVRTHSKGRYIRLFLDAKVRGHADMGWVAPAHRDLLYKAARTMQAKQGGYTGKQTPTNRKAAERRYIRLYGHTHKYGKSSVRRYTK